MAWAVARGSSFQKVNKVNSKFLMVIELAISRLDSPLVISPLVMTDELRCAGEATMSTTPNVEDVGEDERAAEGDRRDDELRRLRIQVNQLKNIIRKLTGQVRDSDDDHENGSDSDHDREEGHVGSKTPKKRRKRADRAFDFTLYKRRHVLFRIAYFGWDLHGFAVQETSGKTVESELFRALKRTKLIQSRETSNYHRLC